MIGLVLAAGAGSRLRPHTDTLPKTLVPVHGELTILDGILANLSAVGIAEVSLVVGHAAEAIQARLSSLQERYEVKLSLIYNDRYDWNNAYSLWLAREAYARGALLVNGDTVHPQAVQASLLTEGGSGLRLTIDRRKRLTDEAMKVTQGADRRITRITKQMVPSAAHGEYIGTARIGADAAEELTRALQDTWADDPSLYYEDGFQLFADRGGDIRGVDPGPIEWVEVDDHADLLTARRITSAAGPGGSRYVSSGS